MVLKIRLARFGRAHQPFYNIVVAHARTARNSLPLEVLGTYDPIPKQHSTIPAGGPGGTGVGGPNTAHPAAPKPYKDIKIDTSRAKYWLGVGAQPSEPARRLLAMLGLCERRFHVKEMIERGKTEEKKS